MFSGDGAAVTRTDMEEESVSAMVHRSASSKLFQETGSLCSRARTGVNLFPGYCQSLREDDEEMETRRTEVMVKRVLESFRHHRVIALMHGGGDDGDDNHADVLDGDKKQEQMEEGEKEHEVHAADGGNGNIASAKTEEEGDEEEEDDADAVAVTAIDNGIKSVNEAFGCKPLRDGSGRNKKKKNKKKKTTIAAEAAAAAKKTEMDSNDMNALEDSKRKATRTASRPETTGVASASSDRAIKNTTTTNERTLLTPWSLSTGDTKEKNADANTTKKKKKKRKRVDGGDADETRAAAADINGPKPGKRSSSFPTSGNKSQTFFF